MTKKPDSGAARRQAVPEEPVGFPVLAVFVDGLRGLFQIEFRQDLPRQALGFERGVGVKDPHHRVVAGQESRDALAVHGRQGIGLDPRIGGDFLDPSGDLLGSLGGGIGPDPPDRKQDHVVDDHRGGLDLGDFFGRRGRLTGQEKRAPEDSRNTPG